MTRSSVQTLDSLELVLQTTYVGTYVGSLVPPPYFEGRPAGEDEGGVPLKGCLQRPPRSAYKSEDRAEAQRRVRAREIQPWRGDDQRRAHGAGEQH